MPQMSSATCYDDLLKIRLSKLRKWGYLKNDCSKSGTLTWSRFGEPFASIGITVYVYGDESRITLSYNHNDQPQKYDISLVSLPSNLGKGEVWYFLCPYTKKRCRVLYLIGGHFLHREASGSCMYESQTRSPFSRAMDKIIDPPYGKQKIHDELDQPYFKTHYAGRPTKRYLWLLQRAGYINRHLLEEALNEL